MGIPRLGSRGRDGGGVINRGSKPSPVKRWDGAARTCSEWDSLRKVSRQFDAHLIIWISKFSNPMLQDPELWVRTGNCFVYLYGKGHSRRGPSFRLPFSALLMAKCYPLIERFMVTDGPHPRTPTGLERWHRADRRRVVELYIPPPSMADKTQAFHYHLATRNFFAWIFRRSIVGQHLGDALVGLLHSMHEFRSGVDDNVADMMGYLDEEGYLDLAGQPNHALAMLHLSEFFQMKELYTRAFAHCVGMSDQLYLSSEYLVRASKRITLEVNANGTTAYQSLVQATHPESTQ